MSAIDDWVGRQTPKAQEAFSREAMGLDRLPDRGARVQKVNWWHEQIVLWELQNPDGKLGECAAHFGVTQNWLSVVRYSDAFQAYRGRVMAAHRGAVSESVIEKAERVTKLSLDVLSERIEKDRDAVPLEMVRKTAETGLKALGYGGASESKTAVQVNIGVGREDLENARQKMRMVVSPEAQKVIEHDEAEQREGERESSSMSTA